MCEWNHKKWVSKCVGGVISLVCTVFVQFFPWQQTACTGRAEGNTALSAKANKGSEWVCDCVRACVCVHTLTRLCISVCVRVWFRVCCVLLTDVRDMDMDFYMQFFSTVLASVNTYYRHARHIFLLCPISWMLCVSEDLSASGGNGGINTDRTSGLFLKKNIFIPL